MRLHNMNLVNVLYENKYPEYDIHPADKTYEFRASIAYNGLRTLDIRLEIQHGKIKDSELYKFGQDAYYKKIIETADKIYEAVISKTGVKGERVGSLSPALSLLIMYLYDMYSLEEIVTGYRGIEANNEVFFVYRLKEGSKTYNPFKNRSLGQLKPWRETSVNIVTLEGMCTEEEARDRALLRESRLNGRDLQHSDIIGSILGRCKLPAEIKINHYLQIYK